MWKIEIIPSEELTLSAFAKGYGGSTEGGKLKDKVMSSEESTLRSKK